MVHARRSGFLEAVQTTPRGQADATTNNIHNWLERAKLGTVANPSLNPRRANHVSPNFIPYLCAFRLGFGLEPTLSAYIRHGDLVPRKNAKGKSTKIVKLSF